MEKSHHDSLTSNKDIATENMTDEEKAHVSQQMESIHSSKRSKQSKKSSDKRSKRSKDKIRIDDAGNDDDAPDDPLIIPDSEDEREEKPKKKKEKKERKEKKEKKEKRASK